MSERNRPAPLQHNRELDALAQTITCPDCSLVLHVTDDTADVKILLRLERLAAHLHACASWRRRVVSRSG